MVLGGIGNTTSPNRQQQQQSSPSTAIRSDHETETGASGDVRRAANPYYDDYDAEPEGNAVLLDQLDYEMTRDADSYVDITAAAEDPLLRSFLHQHNNGSSSGGSTVWAAIFNFTNCIIGAGAIGLGGAMAASGGLISVLTIVAVAILVKQSLDLTLQLSLSSSSANTYEDLGKAAYGHVGKLLVMAGKFAYSFGCLVAYTVVLKDNFGPAVSNLLYGSSSDPTSSYLYWLLQHNVWCTWTVSATVMLPLCLLRDMTPLASASMVSILCMISIVAIVIYFWWTETGADLTPFPDNPDTTNGTVSSSIRNDDTSTAEDAFNPKDLTTGDWYHHWLEIHWLAYLQNLGTFVFCFVCQHTAHLAYASLKPERRNLSTWKRVSTASLCLACTVSLTVGVFGYMTFWDHTQSDIFQIYPSSALLDGAKLLLCMTMLLTFPLPFFTCRELIIVFFFPFAPSTTTTGRRRPQQIDEAGTVDEEENQSASLEEPLLSGISNDVDDDDDNSIVHAGSENRANSNDNSYDDGEEGDDFEAPPLWNRHDSMGGASVLSMDLSVLSARAVNVMNSALLPGRERQLKLSYHMGVTAKLWFITTGLAVAAPNLGDVLDVVGCASGTLIAFILPGLLALKLQGYSHLAALLLFVGGVVGTVGTICSFRQLIRDTAAVAGGGGGGLSSALSQ